MQRVAEPDEKPSRPTPPAEKPPEMVAPTPVAKPTRRRRPSRSRSRRQSVDAEANGGQRNRAGAARAETGGAQIPFGGLTTGGGGTGGARVDVPNFCCPSYLAPIVSQIKRNWSERQSVKGQNTVKFVVHARRHHPGIEVDQSGGQLLDISSERALRVTKQVTPLPREFTGNTLTIYLIFAYSR